MELCDKQGPIDKLYFYIKIHRQVLFLFQLNECTAILAETAVRNASVI